MRSVGQRVQAKRSRSIEREVQACVSGFPAPLMELRRARLDHETRRKRSTRAGITQNIADLERQRFFLGEQPHDSSPIGARGGMCRGAFHDVDQRGEGMGATATCCGSLSRAADLNRSEAKATSK